MKGRWRRRWRGVLLWPDCVSAVGKNRRGSQFKMHVAIFTMSMGKGGTERVISNLCNECLVKKYQISIVTYLKWNCEYQLARKIHTYTLEAGREDGIIDKMLGLITVGKKYVKLMQKIKADIILAFLPRPCLLACLMHKKVGIPVIGSYRSDPEYDMPNLLTRFMVRMLYNRADGFVFQTSQARDFFYKKLRRKSKIIMNPVNEKAIRESFKGERLKRIVSVGRFVEGKNYPLLIRAFASLAQAFEEYTLWIYGKQDDSLGIKELAESLGVAERVVFAGQTDDIYDAIYDASLFVLPSKSEGVPNALMEAMAMGLPVIATDCPCGGPAELVQNGENGILVPNEDEKALVNAMNEMLADEGRAAQMGERALDIGIRYSGQKIYREWEEYILTVVSESI